MSQMHFLALFYSSCGILGESLSFHIASLSFKLNSAFSCGSPTLSLWFMSDPAWRLCGKCNTVHERLRFQPICYTVIIITVVRDSCFFSSGGYVTGEKKHKHTANYAKDLEGTEWTLDQASKLIEKYTAAESQ